MGGPTIERKKNMQVPNLIESIPYGVYVKNKELKYTQFNRQFLKSLKIDNPLMIKDKLDQELPWSCFAESYQKDDHYVIKNRKNLTIINPVRLLKNQSLLLINKRSPIINDSDQVEGIFSMASPIAEHQFCSAMFLLYERDRFYIGNEYKNIGYIISERDGPENLSTKEFECLFFILRGKNARQIAEITFRSVRTIESHIESLKYKFSCTSKSELIEKAIDVGLMRIIPKSIIAKISF